MRQRALAGLIVLGSLAAAAPALAHDVAPAGPQAIPATPNYAYADAALRQREAWLNECRRRIGGNRKGLTGAVLGGVAGGLIGNGIAGGGDKTLGTVAGAAVGAVAGAAIERSAATRQNDRCEDILEASGYSMNYAAAPGYAYQGGAVPAYGYQGYGPAYGYAPVMVMQAMPVQQQMPAKPDCKETVTTEYVTTYDTVYRKVRYARYAPAPVYKRVRIVPDKRVRMTPDKRVTAD